MLAGADGQRAAADVLESLVGIAREIAVRQKQSDRNDLHQTKNHDSLRFLLHAR